MHSSLAEINTYDGGTLKVTKERKDYFYNNFCNFVKEEEKDIKL